MKPLSEVRWGIIGCGNVCEVKSAAATQQATNSRIVAVMRRNGEKAADYARRHGVPRWYDDAGDRGTITFPTFGAPRARLITDEPGEQICEVPHPPHIQQFLIEQVVDALRGRRDSVVSTGETAARTNWVMEQMTDINR